MKNSYEGNPTEFAPVASKITEYPVKFIKPENKKEN
jgi:hypothetical protein